MRGTLTGLMALLLALVAVPAVRPAEPAAASLGPAFRDAPHGLQAAAVVVKSSGDISPPTNETKVDDHATSEIILAAHPDLVLTLGDNQYETGSGAMFHSAIGFDGSWGRIKGLIRPAEGWASPSSAATAGRPAAKSAPSRSGITSAGGRGSSPTTRQPTSSG